MKSEIILSGIGGQGIIMMGKYLGYAAMKQGYKITVAPAYGQEKRGSYVHCQVTIGDELLSPMIAKADAVFAMDDDSVALYESQVKSGGRIIINQDLVTKIPSRDDITYSYLPLSKLALQAGSIKSANMVGIGALIKSIPLITYDNMCDVLREKMPAAILDINLQALQTGYEYL